MTDLVAAEDIEHIVGIERHRQSHYGRAVSAEQTVYILHSRRCLDSGIDLRECRFSLALDEGISESQWKDAEDKPVLLGVWNGRLVPLRTTESPR